MGKRILLIEDVAATNLHVSSILKQKGFTVLSEKDGHEALRLLSDGASVDAIVTDLALPGFAKEVLGGCIVAAWVRRRNSIAKLPIVAITGYTDDKFLGQARRAGIDEIFIKPVDAKALVEYLDAATN